MVIDKGLGYEGLHDLLEVSHAYIDIVKFGFGTSCLYPRHILRQKLSLARVYSVQTCTGGTLGEIAMVQGVYKEYVKHCSKLGFTSIEISDGTIPMSRTTRLQAIQTAKATFPVVISEVGKKLTTTIDIQAYANEIVQDVEAGADFVVVEGRESGENTGFYNAKGDLQRELFDSLTSLLPDDILHKLIWEAPKKSQQTEFIRHFGQDVNLGNIPTTDVLALECLRLGLRADTFASTLSDLEI